MGGPPVTAVGGAEVSPLGEVGFAEDDCACFAELCGHGRVSGYLCAKEGVRAGGVVHLVEGGDVVLDQDREAVERTGGC
jgi:hypothetical protein